MNRNRKPADDDQDEHGKGGDSKPAKVTDLSLAKAAVDERWARRQPTTEQLAACRRGNGPNDPVCLVGSVPGRCDGPMKSVNIVAISRSGEGDDEWIARMCAEQRAWGWNFVEPFGGDSTTYLTYVVRTWLLAERELRLAGRDAAAGDCREAVRSAMTWIALLSWAGVPRTEDRIIEAGETRTMVGRKIDHRLAGTAIAGPRFTTTEHPRKSGLSTDNACASLLSAEIASADGLGLTEDEAVVLRRVTSGDIGAAKTAVPWMYGTLPGWWFQILRVRGVGNQLVYGVHERVNPYKPSFAVGQFLADTGTLVRMTPARPGAVNDRWGAGEFTTEIRDNMIHSRCGTGESSVRALEGAEDWRIDVDGQSVMPAFG